MQSLIARYRQLPHLELIVYLGISIAMLVMLPNIPDHERDWEKNYVAPALTWLGGVHEPWKLHPTFFNPPFVLLLVTPLALLGNPASYIVFTALMLTSLYASARMLGGSPIWLVLSYPGIWMLAFGQLEPLVVLGIAFGWYAIRSKQYIWLTLAYVLLAIKPQIGLVPALLYFVWTPDWKTRLRTSWLTALVIGWTFINWGLWPMEFLPRIATQDNGLSITVGVSLWPIIGPFALALFIPALSGRIDRRLRLLILLAANALASPYSPAYSLLSLLAFPLPWWGYVVASLPVISPNGTVFTRAAMLLPLGVLFYRHVLDEAD
ncbi:MAG: DUF2029 domain-containing protein [Chloroflexi bacterium]|nr:DUF2029 domain-containing protein [Chloroflexota bacterium]